MNFVKVAFYCSTSMGEILMAELAEIGFESFEERDDGIDAYISELSIDEEQVQSIASRYDAQLSSPCLKTLVPKENWNALWEQNYEPIEVGTDIRVRATFHQANPNFRYEIVIDPKMSFGTGHHSTTRLMMLAQLAIDHKTKRFLDLGTGTGVLAILAAKLGAEMVVATDIDDWCVENGKENFERNGVFNTEVKIGVAENLFFDRPFDIVAANINKNVLLNELIYYADFVRSGGYLLLSGFYESDQAAIVDRAKKHGFSQVSKGSEQNWAQLTFQKSELPS